MTWGRVFSAEGRYYIVVSVGVTTRYWAVLVAVTLAAATVAGQQPKPPADRLGVATPLVPAEQAWLFALESPLAFPPVMDGGRVYGATQAGEVRAFSRGGGDPLWSVAHTATAPLSVRGGHLLVPVEGHLLALDATSGLERWHVPLTTPLVETPGGLGDIAFVPVAGGVAAIEVTSGHVRWQQKLFARPIHAVDDAERVYLVLAGGRVVTVSRADGHLLWERDLGSSLTAPTLVPGRVIVGTSGGDVYALEGQDGRVTWRWRLGGAVMGAANRADLLFLVSRDNMVRAVQTSSGNQRWKAALKNRPSAPPVVVGNLVVVSSIAPVVTVLRAETGAVEGTYTAPGELEGPVLVGSPGGAGAVAMVVATRDGRLVGLKPKPPEATANGGALGIPRTLPPPQP